MRATEAELLAIEDLRVDFRTEDGLVHAVDGVRLRVGKAEILGVVGESGSGKSVTALSVLGLLPRRSAVIRGGRILFDGEDLRGATTDRLRQLRGGEIAMIFQDPMTTLNPVMTVGQQIVEALLLHEHVDKKAARERAVELLGMVGIPGARRRFGQYPHEFSGGMRQRVVIAMAIANKPRLLIADEPTTALDVTTQAQILDLLRTAQRETGAAAMVISHDLGVIAELADRVAVMYAGRVVEEAGVRELFAAPRHPYTLGLLASAPRIDTERLRVIPGSPPNLARPPAGCPFHPRCPLARDRCRTERPPVVELGDRSTACHFHRELDGIEREALFAEEVRP